MIYHMATKIIKKRVTYWFSIDHMKLCFFFDWDTFLIKFGYSEWLQILSGRFLQILWPSQNIRSMKPDYSKIKTFSFSLQKADWSDGWERSYFPKIQLNLHSNNFSNNVTNTSIFQYTFSITETMDLRFIWTKKWQHTK